MTHDLYGEIICVCVFFYFIHIFIVKLLEKFVSQNV